MFNHKINVIHFGQKNFLTREGGVEIVVNELSRRQVKCGCDVTCINRKSHHIGGNEYDAKIKNEYEGIKIIYAPTIDIKGLAALSASFFAAIISVFSKCNIVHIHSEGPGFFCFIPKIFGKKVVAHIHGIDWKRDKWKNSFASKFIHSGEKNIVKHANAIIALNTDMVNYFKKTYGISVDKVPNGVNKPLNVKANLIKEKYHLDKDSYILYLSRLVPEKRADLLIEAYNMLNTNTKLVIAGSSSDTIEYCKRLSELAKNNKNIIFTGFVDGKMLDELYSNALVYVLPSEIEGMPLCLLEAMSYGNCCIVSDIPECKEIVEEQGLYFKKGSLIDLKSTLEYVLNNESAINEYKMKSSDFILNKYNWNKTSDSILKIYNRVLNNE